MEYYEFSLRRYKFRRTYKKMQNSECGINNAVRQSQMGIADREQNDVLIMLGFWI
jgi:hypothetical protein